MKFATLRNGTRDGRLVLVSPDHEYALDVSDIAPNLLAAVENWRALAPALRRADARLREQPSRALRWNPTECMAPLPRCFQWCDASAFTNHGRLMQRAFNLPPIPDFDTVPVMYQGASDDFLGPHDDVPLPDEADGIDFEGEFGVVLDEVPLGVSPEAAHDRILLVV